MSQTTFYQLTDEGLIIVEGINAKTFLQGQLTCNLDDIQVDQSRLFARCNLKGRVVANGRLLLLPDGHYALSVPKSMIPALMKDLSKYALFAQVKLIDGSEKYIQYGAVGDSLPIADLTQQGILVHQAVGINRYELIVPASLDVDFAPLSDNSGWYAGNIELGLPMILPETSGCFLPHHLNLHKLDAISFNKGCYLGQEIIARMHYKGKIKKTLKPVIISEDVKHYTPGSEITVDSEGESLTVVNACQHNHQTHLLAMVGQEAD